MKQKIALLFTALLLFVFSQAQVSKESFEEAVDLLNCKTVELTLSNENIQKYQQECPCGETGFSQISQFLALVGKLDATLALSKEVESLKNSFRENWKKEDIVYFLSERIFTDQKYQKIVAFVDRRKDTREFEIYKERLKTNLANKLVENVQQASVAPPLDTDSLQSITEDRIIELEKKIDMKKEDGGILGGLADYLILFAVSLSVIALVVSFTKQKGKDSDISNETKNYIKRKIDDATWNRSTQSSSVGSAELRDANNRIRDLESHIEKIKSQLDTSTPVQSYTAHPNYQETKQAEPVTETFFLSTPNADGSFNESSASSAYKEGATIYRFTKVGLNRAKFQIDEKDASVKLALQYPDKNIDPVCDAVNAFNPKAIQITTTEQGEAELQNGKWIVEKNKKAKIKYEN